MDANDHGDHSGSNQLPFGEQSLKGGREWVTSLMSLETAMPSISLPSLDSTQETPDV